MSRHTATVTFDVPEGYKWKGEYRSAEQGEAILVGSNAYELTTHTSVSSFVARKKLIKQKYAIGMLDEE